jgi:antitoxin HigA-1
VACGAMPKQHEQCTDVMSKSSLSNPHPGEVLLEEFLTLMGISQNALARAAGVPPRRINEIVLGKRGVTADTAVRLAAALGTSERFWLGLQADFDLEEAHRVLGKMVEQIERIAA